MYLLVDGETSGEQHFTPVLLDGVVPHEFDVLILHQSLKFARKVNLLRHPWKRVVAWLDAPGWQNVLGEGAEKIAGFAWATPEIYETEAPKFPEARHVLSECATILPVPPELGPTRRRGLFMGRLPKVYLDQVLAAAREVPMLAMGLYLDFEGSESGMCVPKDRERFLLRPGQYTQASLDAARKRLPSSVELRPAVNIIAKAKEVSQASFGLVPATSNSRRVQVLSASKFWDYLALGLPVVLAKSTPEARHVRANPVLGELYHQGNGGDWSRDQSLKTAIHQVLKHTDDARRKSIQEWVFQHATYKHRASTLSTLFT